MPRIFSTWVSRAQHSFDSFDVTTQSKKRDPSTLSGDSQSKDAANPETKPQTAKKTEIESNIESRIEPRIESKIESKIEPKIESKIESTIESTIESKTNVRPAWSKTDQVSSLALPSKPEPEPEPETDLGIDIEVGDRISNWPHRCHPT